MSFQHVIFVNYLCVCHLLIYYFVCYLLSFFFVFQDGHPPKDRLIIQDELVVVNFGLYIFVVVLSCIGILITLMFLIFNVHYRNERYVGFIDSLQINFEIYLICALSNSYIIKVYLGFLCLACVLACVHIFGIKAHQMILEIGFNPSTYHNFKRLAPSNHLYWVGQRLRFLLLSDISKRFLLKETNGNMANMPLKELAKHLCRQESFTLWHTMANFEIYRKGHFSVPVRRLHFSRNRLE